MHKFGECENIRNVSSLIVIIEQEKYLQRLHPVEHIHYPLGEDHLCLPGTQNSCSIGLAVAKRVLPLKLLGDSGSTSGKTFVANTVAHRIDNTVGFDLPCFMCKQDDEHLSKPRKVLPTLAHRIAPWYCASYRSVLVDLLSGPKGAGIATGDVVMQFWLLFEGSTPMHNCSSPDPCQHLYTVRRFPSD